MEKIKLVNRADHFEIFTNDAEDNSVLQTLKALSYFLGDEDTDNLDYVAKRNGLHCGACAAFSLIQNYLYETTDHEWEGVDTLPYQVITKKVNN